MKPKSRRQIRGRAGVRWWPEIVLLTAAAIALVWAWTSGDAISQLRYMRTYLIVGLTVLGSLAWLLLFSRLPWRLRLGILALCLILGATFTGLFRIRGVTGNLVPLLTWRWSSERRTPASTEPATKEHGDDGTLISAAPGHDFPQFLGPGRDGTIRGTTLSRDWESEPPQEIWRREVGPGWAGFAIAGDLAITQEQDGEEETVVAYDLATGDHRWTHRYSARYATTIGGAGPRATPTIVGDRVYTLGATGVLSALDLADGTEVWSRDVVADNRASIPAWGKSCSPLVIDDRVIVSAGGGGGRSLVAYDAQTGDVAWHSGSDASGYASPLPVTLAGSEQIVIFNHRSVAGHDAADGRLLWQQEWPSDQPNVAQPLQVGKDRLLVSSGYGIGSKLLQIRQLSDGTWNSELLWESPRLKAKFANYVLHDGFVYGLDDGVLVCLDPDTGERIWKRGRYGHGQVLLVEDLLLVLAEKGDVILVEPTPDEHRELGRFTALDRKTWNSPALAGPYLIVRNDKEAVCYRLPVETSSQQPSVRVGH